MEFQRRLHESACDENVMTLSAISTPLDRSDGRNNHSGFKIIMFLVGLAVCPFIANNCLGMVQIIICDNYGFTEANQSS